MGTTEDLTAQTWDDHHVVIFRVKPATFRCFMDVSQFLGYAQLSSKFSWNVHYNWKTKFGLSIITMGYPNYDRLSNGHPL